MFFYSDEGLEPIHVHARKGDAECKLWLRTDAYGVELAWAHALSPQLHREIRKIVFDHFGLIVEEWGRYFEGHDNAANQTDHSKED